MRSSQSRRALTEGGHTPLHVSWDGAGIAVDGSTGITYVCGGLDVSVNDVGSFGKVLRFTPSSCVWDHVECGGNIPLPRRHHTMCFFNRRLVVCGGELISEQSATLSEKATSEKGDIALGKGDKEEQVPFSLSSQAVGALEVYVLDLDTCCWSAFTSGDSVGEGGEGEAPVNRYYHTSTVIGNAMLVIGGKPTPADTTTSGTCTHRSRSSYTRTINYFLTNASMLELKTQGFYNLHVLNLETMKWKQLSSSQSPSMPFVWGHAAVHMKESGLVAVVGGVDVKASGDIAKRIPTTLNDLPEAMPNTSVYLLDVRYMSWSFFTLSTMDFCVDQHAKCPLPPPPPPACAGITAVNIPNTDELLICNGWTIGATALPSANIIVDCVPLSPKPNTAAYIFNLVSRRWRQISWPPAPLENYRYTSTCTDNETDKAGRRGCSSPLSQMYRPSIVITCPPLFGLTEEREWKGHREYEEGRSDGQPRQQNLSLSRSTRKSGEFVAVAPRTDVLAALDCRLVPRLQGWRRVVTQFAPSGIRAGFSSQRISLPTRETLAQTSTTRLSSRRQGMPAGKACDDLDESAITPAPRGLFRKHVVFARYNRLLELEKTAERILETAETQSAWCTHQLLVQIGSAASSSAQVGDKFANHTDLATASSSTETSSLKSTLRMLRKERKKAARTIRKEALN